MCVICPVQVQVGYARCTVDWPQVWHDCDVPQRAGELCIESHSTVYPFY